MPLSQSNSTVSSLFWLPVVGTALLLAVSTGCDWTVDSAVNSRDSVRTDTLQTSILDVRVQPSPIPAGDTATFTVVLADSTDPSFEYRWYLAGIGPVVITDTNAVQWPAPEEAGTARHLVVADNGSDSLTAPTREFEVSVEADNSEQ